MQPIVLSAMSATAAGILFYLATRWPDFPGRRRIAIAAMVVVLDWLPLGFSMMAVPGAPSRVLLWAHLGFGVIGYIGLAGLAWHWIHGRTGSRRLRMLFIGGWTIG